MVTLEAARLAETLIDLTIRPILGEELHATIMLPIVAAARDLAVLDQAVLQEEALVL